MIPVPKVEIEIEEEPVLDIDFSSAGVFESILSGGDISIQVRLKKLKINSCLLFNL